MTPDARLQRQGEPRHSDATGGEAYDEYHRLVARQDAMRLRRRLLSPARPSYPGAAPALAAGPEEAGRPYDGAADRRTIHRYLPLVTPIDELIAHLYDAMFEQHPSLRGLFPASMDFQRAHLERAIRYLIDHLDRPADITAFCSRLGRDHRKLGVRPVHYQVFEGALAQALRRSAGSGWTDGLERAWLRMLRLAVAAMVDGADEALAEPASWSVTVTDHQLRRPDLAVIRVRTAEPFPYRAGQYTRLQSPLLPHAWRPYSLARAPRPDGELEFHVRRTGPGGVSEALVTGTRAGDTLRLGPAQGSMTLDDDLPRDVLIAAGGTGWATAKALLEELAGRRPHGCGVHLFLGARTLDDLYDTAALTALERGRPWLRVVPVIGEGPGTAEDRSVADALARQGDWSGHLAYVSGPPSMVTSTVRRLTALHVPADRIRHDPVDGTR